MSEQSKIWDKQESESSKAFHAFTIYLGLGADRSTYRVAQKLGYKNSKGVQEWSSKFNWVKRAEAYDQDSFSQFMKDNRLRNNSTYNTFLKLFQMPAVVLANKLAKNPDELIHMPVKELYRLIIDIGKLLPVLADAQEMNINRFIEDMKSEAPDDEFAKVLENEVIKAGLDGLLENL